MVIVSYILLTIGSLIVVCSIICEDNVPITFSLSGVVLVLMSIILKAIGG